MGRRSFERTAHCAFLEYVYFARNDSVIDGQPVYESRFKWVVSWPKKSKDIHPDIVISAPDSGTPAAIGYSLEAGIPFMEGLTKIVMLVVPLFNPTQKQALMLYV